MSSPTPAVTPLPLVPHPNDPPFTAPEHGPEPHDRTLGARLNWLRAGVLGANDGIVSVAGVVVGVAGATSSLREIFTAGVAATVAGAFSMAGGEYVSVSTQRDTETAALAKECWELATIPEEEERELARLYEERGLSPHLAAQVARELTQEDALKAHAEMELGIDSEELTNPWAAALSSFVAFTVGAALPLLAMAIPLDDERVLFSVIAVAIGLFLTGYVSAKLGGAPARPAVLRNVGMGVLTMLVTWGIGKLLGTTIGG
ncbi:MAG: VIT family protein [Thermomicrobiales bacterium]